MEYPSLEYPLYILICFPNLLHVSVVKTLPLLNTFDGSEILQPRIGNPATKSGIFIILLMDTILHQVRWQISPLFTRFYTSQVVQECVCQQYQLVFETPGFSGCRIYTSQLLNTSESAPPEV